MLPCKHCYFLQDRNCYSWFLVMQFLVFDLYPKTLYGGFGVIVAHRAWYKMLFAALFKFDKKLKCKQLNVNHFNVLFSLWKVTFLAVCILSGTSQQYMKAKQHSLTSSHIIARRRTSMISLALKKWFGQGKIWQFYAN